MTVSTAAGMVLTGSGPLVPFWFLFGQAKRNIRLPAALGRPYKLFSHAISFFRAQKGNEVSHKVFLLTFFSKKVSYALLNCFSSSFRVSSIATGRP